MPDKTKRYAIRWFLIGIWFGLVILWAQGETGPSALSAVHATALVVMGAILISGL